MKTALANDGVKLSAESKIAEMGDTVIININIENAAEITGGQFDLSYNPDMLKVTNIEKGQFVASADEEKFMSNKDYADNRLRVIWVTTEADTDNTGVVCSINFEVNYYGTSD